MSWWKKLWRRISGIKTPQEIRKAKIEELCALNKAEATEFVKDFRKLWWKQLSAKYELELNYVLAGATNDVVNHLVKKHSLVLDRPTKEKIFKKRK